MNNITKRRAGPALVSVVLGLAFVAGCGSTSSGVTVQAATPAASRPKTTEQQAPSKRPRPPTTENHNPGTALTPTTDSPVPSIEQQAEAQALIDEVPKLVGDTDLQRKSTQIDDALKTALQAIADGKAGGDDAFLLGIEKSATGVQSPGEITNGSLESKASVVSITGFASGITRFGPATVVDSGALEILIVAAD